jgi:drug/metabolite transporter (DMT)-like permease
MAEEQPSATDEATVLTERPLLAGAAIALAAAVVWVGISLGLRDTVDPIETVLFAVIFAVVYVGSHYL